MLYMGNPSSPAVVEAMRAGVLGFIGTPGQGNTRPHGVTWCADNGAFGKDFDVDRWWAWLVRHQADAGSCLFATAPDVVGDAQGTLDRSRPWLPRIRELGYPAALVAQNGLEYLAVPWEEFDVLFVGGVREFAYSPRRGLVVQEWKLGPHAIQLCAEAKARGKRVHVGRVNTRVRLRKAAEPPPHGLGADSCDGTTLTRGADRNLPYLLSWLRELDHPKLWDDQEPDLFDAIPALEAVMGGRP